MGSLVIGKAPTCVCIGQRKVKINTDFRTSIKFELMMDDETFSKQKKVEKALRLYYGDVKFFADEIEDAVNGLLWFYACGKDPDEVKDDGKRQAIAKKHISAERVYDYDYDADYIYSAFRQQYGVDIQTEKIHWWKFKAMFKSLNDQCEFMKIMGYRSIKISNNMTKSQKEFYQDMKRIHALPLPKSEQQRLAAIEEALLNGGDLSAIMGIHNGPG